MNDERFFDLAMKAIVHQASSAECVELEAAMASEPSRKIEWQNLQAQARLTKEVLALTSAVKSTQGEFPAYARERLQTKVRQTLGRPQAQEKKASFGWRWFLVLAPATAVLVLLLLITAKPHQPIIEIAMLDGVGLTRGGGTNDVTLLEQQWKGVKVQTFARSDELASWEQRWPSTKALVTKVIYDPAAAEIRVLLRSEGKLSVKAIPVDRDLSVALRQAEAFIKAQTAR